MGYLIPDISDPYYAEIYKGINKIASDRGYICALEEIQSTHQRKSLALHRYDGLISTADFIVDIAGLDVNMDIPIVVLAENTLQLALQNYAIVSHQFEEVMLQAYSYLFDKGHREIGIITCDLPSLNREEIYRKALEKHGQVFKEERVVRFSNPTYSYTVGASAMEELIKRKTGVTAVLAQNDLIAIGAMSAARHHGMRIPDDLSIIGCGDTVVAGYSNPTLSTIKLFKEKQGEKAAQLLFDLMDGKKVTNYVFRAQLILREST